MAQSTKTEPWAIARERFADRQKTAGDLTAAGQKINAAIAAFEWKAGDSTLPLIDLERQKQMLAPKVQAATKALEIAKKALWASDSPAVAEAVARALDGAFMDGASASAHVADPGDEGDKPGFIVIQSAGHQINPGGSVAGTVQIKLAGPKWARGLLDVKMKIAIADHLYNSGVRFSRFSGSRDVANAWGETGLNIEVTAWPGRPFVSHVPTGPLDGASVIGGWNWRGFARNGRYDRVNDSANSDRMPSLIPDVLDGGDQRWTVESSSIKDGIRTTELTVSIHVGEQATTRDVETAKGAVSAMAVRGVLADVGRLTEVEVQSVEPYERPTFSGSDQVTRGFTVKAKAKAVGEVR